MDPIRQLLFNLRYLCKAPWDSGFIAPEVVAFIQQHQPGRALDLGCGTGTSSLALARAGWTVDGIDFSRRAIYLARRKAGLAKLTPNLRVADVTRLPKDMVNQKYNLVLDIGCFHGLTAHGKDLYLRQLPNLLVPAGFWMLYGFLKESSSQGPGLIEEELTSPTSELTLIKRDDGMDKKDRHSVWLWYSRNGVLESRVSE